MVYLGLVPSESSSGDKRRLGKLTKCGNGRARRLLIEGAHTYKYKANISTELQKRQEGKHRNLVVAAIAGEMIAYIWAISREVVITPIDPKTRLARLPA